MLKQSCAIVISILLTNCLHLPQQRLIETPRDSATMIELPTPASDIWIAEQGIPLKIEWLSESHTKYPYGEMFILSFTLSELPYLNTEESATWVDSINQQYQPELKWVYNGDNRMGHYKCMSLSEATVLNWHILNSGEALSPFTSWLSGKQERGVDHRALDALYYERASQPEFEERYKLLDIQSDPIEKTPISYSMPAFAEIISIASEQPSAELISKDPVLQNVTHTLNTRQLPSLKTVKLFDYEASYKVRKDDTKHTQLLKDALHQYGPIFAGIRVRFASSGGVITDNAIGRLSIPNMSGHGVVIVGYVEQESDTYFIYRETFGKFNDTSNQGGPAYRVYPAHSFNEAYAFDNQAKIELE